MKMCSLAPASNAHHRLATRVPSRAPKPLAPPTGAPVDAFVRPGLGGRRALVVRASGSEAAERWRDFAHRVRVMEPGNAESVHHALDALAPPDAAPPVDLEIPARVREAFTRADLDHDLQLRFLARLSDPHRAEVVERLPTQLRRTLTGPQDHPKAKAERSMLFDWGRFADPGAVYSPATSWGFSTLSDAIYYPFGASGRDPERVGAHFAPLARAGFELEFFGDERDAKGRSALVAPALIARRADVAILAVRGTETKVSPRSVQCDLDTAMTPAAGGRVHRGFVRASDEVWEAVGGRVAELGGSGTTRLYLAGHSLGGFINMLLAEKIAREELGPIESVYTYGAPRGFDRDAVAELERLGIAERLWRVENHGDPTPGLPYHVRGLVHPGTRVYLDAAGQARVGMSDAAASRASKKADSAATGWDAHHTRSYTRKLYLAKDG